MKDFEKGFKFNEIGGEQMMTKKHTGKKGLAGRLADFKKSKKGGFNKGFLKGGGKGGGK